jgi:hypothetical protein
MAWHVEYLAQEQVITVEFSGTAGMDDLKATGTQCIAVAREHATYAILADAREMTLTAQTTELYHLPDTFEEQGLTRHYRVAMVISDDSDQKESFTFFETVFVNRGFQMRLFSKRDAALEWLRYTRRPSDRPANRPPDPSDELS